MSHSENALFLLKCSSLYPGINQKNEDIVIMTKEGSTKIVIFMIPRAGIPVPGRGHISRKMKCVIFQKKNLLLYSRHDLDKLNA